MISDFHMWLIYNILLLPLFSFLDSLHVARLAQTHFVAKDGLYSMTLPASTSQFLGFYMFMCCWGQDPGLHT